MELIDIAYRVFSSSGFYSWPKMLKQDYIRNLIDKYELKRKDLQLNIIDWNDPKKIVQVLQNVDKDFQVFARYHERYERTFPKVVEIYSVCDLLPEEKKNIQSRIKRVKYSFDENEDWTPVEVKTENEIASVSMARRSQQMEKTSLQRSDVDEGVWQSVAESARRKLGGTEGIIKVVKVELISPKRNIVTINLDIKNKTLEICSDQYQEDPGQKALTGKIIQQRKKPLTSALDLLGITTSKKEILEIVEKPSIITNPEAMYAFSRRNRNQLLVVSFTGDFRVGHAIAELTEDITSRLPNQRPLEIKNKAEIYFDEKGSFDGFFSQYTEHATENASEMKRLRADKGTKRKDLAAYAFIVRDGEDHEKANKYTGHMKTKVIDYIVFKYDTNFCVLEMKNVGHSESAYRAFISEVLSNSRKAQH